MKFTLLWVGDSCSVVLFPTKLSCPIESIQRHLVLLNYSSFTLINIPFTEFSTDPWWGVHLFLSVYKSGVHHAMNPDPYRGIFGSDGEKYAKDVQDLIDYGTCGQVAGFIAEAIQVLLLLFYLLLYWIYMILYLWNFIVALDLEYASLAHFAYMIISLI